MTTSTLHSSGAVDLIRGAATPIIALDYPSVDAALDMVDRLERADFFKVGLQLYTAAGPGLVTELGRRGKKIFLDLKLHDIPNTVKGAVESAAAHGVDLLTIHATGGEEMLAAAAEAASGVDRLRLLAVTVLTSMNAGDLGGVWGRPIGDVEAEVVRLADLAAAAGIDGVVSSVSEAASLKDRHPDLVVVTPGIRLAGSSADDQARVATPHAAAEAGADFIVVGRTVTAADDPAAAYDQVLRSIAGSEESSA